MTRDQIDADLEAHWKAYRKATRNYYAVACVAIMGAATVFALAYPIVMMLR